MADILLISPPWGGPDYKRQDTFNVAKHICVGGCDGAELLELGLRMAPAVVYYLPLNTDRAQLARLAATHGVPVTTHEYFVTAAGSKQLPSLCAYFGARFSFLHDEARLTASLPLLQANKKMHAIALRGDAMGARRQWQQMQESGVGADAITYTSLIHACGKAGLPDQAYQWFAFMQQQPAHSLDRDEEEEQEEEDGGGKHFLLPTTRTYNALIAALLQLGDKTQDSTRQEQLVHRLQQCMQLLAAMRERRRQQQQPMPDSTTYDSILHGCLRASDLQLMEACATCLAEDIVVVQSAQSAESAERSALYPSPRLCGKLLRAWWRAGQLGKAEHWLRVFQEEWDIDIGLSTMGV